MREFSESHKIPEKCNEIVDEIADTPVGFDGQSPIVTPVIESMVVL